MHNYRFFKSKFFKDCDSLLKYRMLDVSCDLSTSPWILTSCMEMNFWFLDFGKEIYVDMERQHLNQIFHYVSSLWLSTI